VVKFSEVIELLPVLTLWHAWFHIGWASHPHWGTPSGCNSQRSEQCEGKREADPDFKEEIVSCDRFF